MLFLAILALVSLPTPSASQGENTTLPLTVPTRITGTNQQVCSSDEVREIVREEIDQDIQNLMRNTIISIVCGGPTQASPAASCSALPTSCPSGYYWIRIPNGTAVQLYCDVDRYAHTSPNAFRLVASRTLEDSYVDGVSLTHGSPGARQHIWTFAGGLFETYNSIFHPTLYCPCVQGTTNYIPTYVGNDYFCESGNPGTALFTNVLYGNDPLWDGQGCGSPPCCELSSPPGVTAPWFCKQLPQATTDDIEVRICKDESNSSEDTPVELIELYIR